MNMNTNFKNWFFVEELLNEFFNVSEEKVNYIKRLLGELSDLSKSEELEPEEKEQQIENQKDKIQSELLQLIANDKNLSKILSKIGSNIDRIQSFSNPDQHQKVANKSTLEFINYLRNYLTSGRYADSGREIAGVSDEEGRSMISNVARSDTTSSGKSRDLYDLGSRRITKEFEKEKEILKNMIKSFMNENPLQGVLLCKTQGINCDNLNNDGDLYVEKPKVKRTRYKKRDQLDQNRYTVGRYSEFISWIDGASDPSNPNEEERRLAKDFSDRYFYGVDKEGVQRRKSEHVIGNNLTQILQRVRKKLRSEGETISDDVGWRDYLKVLFGK